MVLVERFDVERFVERPLNDYGLVTAFKPWACENRVIEGRTASLGITGAMVHGQSDDIVPSDFESVGTLAPVAS